MKSPGSLQPHLVAHQGGWDEILLVVGPLALVAGLLWLANRRVSAQLDASEPVGGEPDGRGPGGDDLAEASGEADGSPGAETRP